MGEEACLLGRLSLKAAILDQRQRADLELAPNTGAAAYVAHRGHSLCRPGGLRESAVK